MRKAPLIRENLALERKYQKNLEKFTKACLENFYLWLKPKFKSADYSQHLRGEDQVTALVLEFEELISFWEKEAEIFADNVGRKQVDDVNKFVNNQYTKNGLSVSLDEFTREMIEAQVAQQVELIKSIPQNIKKDLQGFMLENLNSLNAKAVSKYLEKVAGINKRKAKLIARDQTQKILVGAIRAKALSLGAEYYSWETARDERVSTGYGGHKQLQSRIYRYDSPSAVIDSYGTIGHTGQRVNCRCIPITIFLEPDEKVIKRRDGSAGDFYQVTKK